MEKACCFFGHKDTPDSVKDDIYAAIEKLIVEYSVDTFYVGNQGRFDAIARSILRELKEEYPQIDYVVVLAYMPCKQHEDDLDTMLPEGIEFVHPRYAISWRNSWMLQQSDYVVTYITHSWGGAAKFADKARKQGKRVFNIQ